ncbi:MAG: thiamine/thiamine pyrophosphate ABC transporter permease ThiP [Paracoccaceae bacterium]|nr:MAG: thiamine/thiamine pyrophosphate ABC transporter permease ThiP [Paracoccaceae bacterium]
MAGSARALGWGALGLVGLALAAPVAALFAAAGTQDPGPQALSVLRFTLVQAALSAAISCLAAMPLARALARRRFPGRGALIAITAAPFVLPSLVAVLGIAAVWGRAGPVSDALAWAGLARLDIYGLAGMVTGHVFFNLPLVARMLLQGWAAVPAEHHRLAEHLGLTGWARFRLIEAPVLREVLPGAFLLVFLLAMTSFSVALTLGGGPGAATLEVAIYQALRFEFAPGRAAVLALIQLVLALGLGLGLLALGRGAGLGPGLDLPRLPGPGGWRRAADAAAIATGAGFLIAPLLAVALRGAPALLAGLPDPVWRAAAVSAAIAPPSAALALGLAGAIGALAAGGPGGRLAEALGVALLAASPFVMGTGLFLILNPVTDPFALALPVTVLVNALMALPFGLRLMVPALARAEADWGRLADSLGIRGWARLRLVIWPRVRRPAALTAGLAAALSVGDLGVITLFAPPDLATLPLAVYRLMGAYRMDDAMGAALVLAALSLVFLAAADRAGGRDDPA